MPKIKKTLKEWCEENNRYDLIAQWDDKQNIEKFSKGSDYKAQWKCTKCGGIWEAIIYSRTKENKPTGCPYCANQKVLKGSNDFESMCMKNNKEYLIKEWDYNKNTLKPDDVVYLSNKKAHWKCKHGHTWEVKISNRTGPKESGCPYCSNRIVSYDFNDFETWCKNNDRKDLLREWDYDKNKIKPNEVTAFSNNKVHWKCKHGHTWKIGISNRTGPKKSGCPYCSNQKVWPGFNDLETHCKNSKNEQILLEWDYNENAKLGLTPQTITYGSKKKVHWKCTKNHKWIASISSRTSKDGRGCAVCSGKRLLTGENDLETYCKENNSTLLKDWDYDKNLILPSQITAHNNKNVYWKCHKCGHEWKARIDSRVSGNGCPECNIHGTSFPEQAILYYIKQYFPDTIHRYKGFGCELDIYIPSIKVAIEYDGLLYHKNNNRENVKNILCKENDIKLIRIRENGLCNYDNCICIFRKNNKAEDLDEAINKIFIFLDIKNIIINVQKDRTTIMEQYRISELNNSLAIKFPQIAKEWHPTLNGNLKPENFSYGSHEKVYWLCNKCGNVFPQIIKNRTVHNQNCPECAKKKRMKKVLCVETGEVFDSISTAAKKHNIKNPSQLSSVCKGEFKTAGGCHWKYVDENNKENQDNV